MAITGVEQPTGGLTLQVGFTGLRVGSRFCCSRFIKLLGELSRWFCLDDSTMNTVICTRSPITTGFK